MRKAGQCLIRGTVLLLVVLLVVSCVSVTGITVAQRAEFEGGATSDDVSVMAFIDDLG
jgi:hypothetical protein